MAASKIVTLWLLVASSTALRHGSMPQARLLTHNMCPFAQKACIALEWAQIPYQPESIDLYGTTKPQWFWELNPQGTVPVLVYQDIVLPDSDLILDAIADGTLPNARRSESKSSPQIKAWRSLINDMLPIGKKAVLARYVDSKLEKLLGTMEDRIVGPFLVGPDPTLADCHAFPFVWRLEQEIGLKAYPKLQEWVNKCGQHPIFAKTIQRSWWWWW